MELTRMRTCWDVSMSIRRKSWRPAPRRLEIFRVSGAAGAPAPAPHSPGGSGLRGCGLEGVVLEGALLASRHDAPEERRALLPALEQGGRARRSGMAKVALKQGSEVFDGASCGDHLPAVQPQRQPGGLVEDIELAACHPC